MFSSWKTFYSIARRFLQHRHATLRVKLVGIRMYVLIDQIIAHESAEVVSTCHRHVRVQVSDARHPSSVGSRCHVETRGEAGSRRDGPVSGGAKGSRLEAD